jgi:hypothetical protein
MTRDCLRTIGIALLFILLAMLVACTSPGCGMLHQSKAVNTAIKADTASIDKSVKAAQVHIGSADEKVLSATTQPGNPPLTVSLLGGAHKDLSAAQKDLSPVAPALKSVEKKADEQAQITDKAIKQRDAERDHWIGYKGRVLLWSLAGLLPLLAIVLFIIRTNGGGPILLALGEVAGNCLSFAWAFIRAIPFFLVHLFTLGSLKLADLTNKHYEQQQTSVSQVAQEARKGVAPLTGNDLLD